MATLSATNISVFGHTTVTGPSYDSSNKAVFGCHFTCEFSGTYVQADNAAVSALTTAIADGLRTSDTIALLDAAFAAPGIEGSSTVIGAKTVTVSGSGLTLELTGADLSTEHAGATLSALTKPLAFYVTYTRV
jgi:hypothetical protein